MNKTSKYVGVRWSKRANKWKAVITEAEQSYYLGTFNSPEAAARAYDRAALKYRGKHTKLHFPENIRLYNVQGFGE